MHDVIWLHFISGTTHSKLSRRGCWGEDRAALYSFFTSVEHQQLWTEPFLLDCVVFFYWLFIVTAMKSLTMTARVDAVCNPLRCTWQPSSEAGQAMKWFWVVDWGFRVTAYLRDFLRCHLRRFKEEFPCRLIFDTVGVKVDRLDLFFFNLCFNEDKRKQHLPVFQSTFQSAQTESQNCVNIFNDNHLNKDSRRVKVLFTELHSTHSTKPVPSP